MTGRILALAVGCFALGAVMIALASRRADPAVRRGRWFKYASYAVIVLGFLLAATLGRPWLLAVAVGIVALGGWELGQALARVDARARELSRRVVPLYGLLAGLLLFAVWHLPADTVAFLYLVVAAFDGFCQIVGQLVGRHLLVPSISPAKTVEGLVGGIVGAVVIAVLIRPLAGYSVPVALAAGIGVALAGFAGDLAGSWLKRRAGIKDFSRLVPAHGGVLDRFGSFLFAGGLIGAPLAGLDAASG